MRFALAAAVLALLLTTPSASLAQGCPERPNCEGCGCKGGPGYRSYADNQCVGFADLESVCGVDPDDIGEESVTCRFENAPNTGANRWCAFGLKDPT